MPLAQIDLKENKRNAFTDAAVSPCSHGQHAGRRVYDPAGFAGTEPCREPSGSSERGDRHHTGTSEERRDHSPIRVLAHCVQGLEVRTHRRHAGEECLWCCEHRNGDAILATSAAIPSKCRRGRSANSTRALFLESTRYLCFGSAELFSPPWLPGLRLPGSTRGSETAS